MKKRILFFMITMVLLSAQAIAQSITATGTVTAKSDGEPLIGVAVKEVGTQNGVATDLDGNFKLQVKKGAKLQFSYVGFQPQTLSAAAGMKVVLDDSKEMNELVVVGYQTMRKVDLTGAVGVMDMKKPKDEGSANIINSMEGRIAGVNVFADPAPGGGSSSIQIRGMSSFRDGGNGPLYVIDGVAAASTDFNLNSLNPNDIESIQVLKDASSASIYGSRAANGVVIITTKSGKGGKLQVNLGYSASAQFVSKTHQMLNANQWGAAYYQAATNAGVDPLATMSKFYTFDAEGNAYLNNYVTGYEGVNGYKLGNTDWQKAIYQTAWTHNVNASISNSSDKGSVMFSANYMNQKGTMKESKYNRYTVRLNSTFNFNKWITVGENLQLAKWNNNIGSTGGDAAIPWNTMRQFPGLPVYQPNGTMSEPYTALGSDIASPMVTLYNSRDNDNESWRIFGNAFLEYKPIKGLTLKTSLGYDHVQYDNDVLTRSTDQTPMASVTRSYGRGDTWTWTNTATYSNKWGKHALTALMGVEAIGYKTSNITAYRDDYYFEDANYMVLDAGTGTQTNGGGKAAWGLFSLFWKADYNYADRYLASFTLRRDATSRLGRTNNAGVFPAVSAAWRISSEKFWNERVKNVCDYMKLRFAWGQNGNSEIGNYATYNTLAYNQGNAAYDLYGTNTSSVAGLVVASSGNSSIKWETTSQFNIGLDMRFFNSSLGFSGDFYVKKTTDMLTQPPTMSVEGENATQWKNTGSMRNIGVEFTIDYQSKKYGDFSFETSLNMAHYRNKVLELNDQQTTMGGDVRVMKNQPLGVYYGYVCDGIFQNQEQVYNHATQEGAEPGRLIYRDINGDGKITSADQCIIGNPNPNCSMGLNLDLHWKRFTLSTFFTGEFGFDIINSTKHQLDFFSYGNATTNRGVSTLNAWTPTNTDTDVPALSLRDNNNEARFSTYYVEDGSYFKMKYIKLSYSLPEKICKKFLSSSLNVYAQLDNVFTITNYSGLDPEIASGSYGAKIDNGPYPRSRTFTMGVNVSF